MSRKEVLVVGGSGYLGQHLHQAFSLEAQFPPYDLAFTYHSTPLENLIKAIPHSRSFHADLRTGDGFDYLLDWFDQGLSLEISNIFNVAIDGSITNEENQDMDEFHEDEDYEDEADEVEGNGVVVDADEC